MTDRELMQQALKALANEAAGWELPPQETRQAIVALRARLEQPEPEPVAWLITDEMINSLQIDSIQRLIDRARRAHMTDIKLRINGQDEWYEADWLKHLKRAAPPQRNWQSLTDEEISELIRNTHNTGSFVRFIETKLKEKNFG